MPSNKLKIITIIVLLLSSLVFLRDHSKASHAASQDAFGIVVSTIYGNYLSNPTEYANLLNVFVRQGVRYAVIYDYSATAAQISQAKSLGIKILVYVTGLKEPANVITTGITLWPGGPVVYPQQSWAQYDVDSNGNPTSHSKFLYPADVGASEIYFSPYGPYVDQVVLPRVNHFIQLGADGIFLDTLFLFWDSPAWGGTGTRYGGGESYSKVVWQTRYSGLSFLQFRYKATHDVVQRVYSTIAGRGILSVSNNGINSESDRLGFASSIDQWQDVADAFVLEYLTAGTVPYDPPDIVLYTWVLFWKNVMGVSKPIWQLYYTTVDWQFQYMTNGVIDAQAGFWQNPEYIRTLDSRTPGKKRSVLTLDFTGSGSPGSIKMEGYLYDAFTGTGLGGKQVHLRYSLDKYGQTWNILPDASTDVNGYYSQIWTPAGHPYNLTAYWDGDLNYNSWRVYEATYVARAKQEPPYVSPDPIYWVYNFRRYEIQGGLSGAAFAAYGLSSANVRIDTWEPWPWPYPPDLSGWPQQWASYPMLVGGSYHRILPAGSVLDGSQRLPPESGLTPPAAPTGLTATMVSSFTVSLSWTYSGSNYDYFRIERKTGAGGTYGEIASVPAGTVTYTNDGLAASTTYLYRVRAYRVSDNQYSSYSNEASATTDVPFQFTISPVLPNPQNIQVGGSATVSFTVTTTQSTPQEVLLTPTNLPSGISISSFQSYVTPSPTGTAVTLTLSASSSATTGTYNNLYIYGTGGGATAQSPMFTLNVLPAPLNFSISTQQASVAIAQGSSGSNTVTVTLISGTIQPVTLSTSGLPSGTSPSFNPTSGNPTFTSTLTITVSSTATAGRYTITVTGVGGGTTRTTTFSLAIQPRIVRPPSYLASNPLGRVFFIFNDKKYYITNPAAFSSYGLNWADVKPWTVMNPDNYQSSQINYDYLLDGKMPLPNRPYIAGDANDGSLYYIPYFSWTGDKYPITWAGYNAYNGYLKTLPTRFGDPALSLSTSSTILDGVTPIPTVTPPSYVIGKNPLQRVFFIFNSYKYYFTDWSVYLAYGFTANDINPSVNPDTYPTAQVRFDYLLEDTTSVFRKPLPNQPYIVGDVNDGSLYYVPYYTWTGEKYPITWAGYNAYGGQLQAMHKRFGDPSILLPTSAYMLDGLNPLPIVV
jgi:hypothetical protein